MVWAARASSATLWGPEPSGRVPEYPGTSVYKVRGHHTGGPHDVRHIAGIGAVEHICRSIVIHVSYAHPAQTRRNEPTTMALLTRAEALGPES